MRRRRLEHELQEAVFAWVEIAQQQHPELALLFAIEPGVRLSIGAALRLKRRGVRSGVPDLCLPVKTPRSPCLWIELKSPRGRLAPGQRWRHQAMARWGHPVTVCRSWGEVLAALENHLGRALGPGPSLARLAQEPLMRQGQGRRQGRRPRGR